MGEILGQAAGMCIGGGMASENIGKAAPDPTVGEMISAEEDRCHARLAELEAMKAAYPESMLKMRRSAFNRLFRIV